MEDRELVAAVAAGDPAGLAGAYDTYAESLYGYCRWMLAEPGDAAQAVQDTFVLAAGRLGQLRDPGKVRSWLFSTARGECLRRAGAGAGAGEELEGAGTGAAEGGTGAAEGDQAADARREAERAELRRLIRTTLAGLAAREREAVELSLWHDLDDTDLAAVLGVSRPRAYALASDGRRQLEKTLGVVRTARTGREACRELGLWLEDWDGQLNAATLELVSRHSEHCEICGRRQGGTLRPAALGRLLPLPALPPGLREQVLERCAAAAGAAAPGAVQEAVQEAGRAGRAGWAGWDRIRRNPRAMAAMAVVLVAVAVSVPLIAVGGAHAVRNLVAQSNGGGAGDLGAAGGARGQASASAGSGASRSPQPGAVAPVTFLQPSAGSSRNVTPSRSPRPKPPGSPQASGSASASSSASSSTTPAIGPTPSRVASSAGTSPSPSPTPTPTPSPSPSPAPTSS
jgi:RNA polymerase sigma factor (sigma-70 family)